MCVLFYITWFSSGRVCVRQRGKYFCPNAKGRETRPLSQKFYRCEICGTPGMIRTCDLLIRSAGNRIFTISLCYLLFVLVQYLRNLELTEVFVRFLCVFGSIGVFGDQAVTKDQS